MKESQQLSSFDMKYSFAEAQKARRKWMEDNFPYIVAFPQGSRLLRTMQILEERFGEESGIGDTLTENSYCIFIEGNEAWGGFKQKSMAVEFKLVAF